MKYIFICLACVATPGTIQAQPAAWKSQVQLTAESLVARTQPDYFSTRSLRTGTINADPCDLTLPCTGSELPVKLLSFSGERIDNANVSLFWKTGEEVNNDHFQVERTLNPSWGYEPVATVKGAGSASSAIKYQITDPNDNSGYTYYRLKQVDINGTFEYSTVIAIKGADVPLSVTAFPNPGRSKNVTFKVNGLKVTEEMAVIIYDIRGRIVFQDNNYSISPEKPNMKFDLPELSGGKYSIRIKGMNHQATSSFVVVH